MKILLLLMLVSSLNAKKSPYEKSEGVLVLTEKNYDLAVAEFDYLLCSLVWTLQGSLTRVCEGWPDVEGERQYYQAW